MKISPELMDCHHHILYLFYHDKLNLDSKTYLKSENFDGLLNSLIDIIINISCGEILKILKDNYTPSIVTQNNIPQFSNFHDAYIGVPKGIFESGWEWSPFYKIGFLLRTQPRKKGADSKYGENHSKLAFMMGLVDIDRKKGVSLSDFGRKHLKLDDGSKENLKAKLCLRIPIIKNYFCEENDDVIARCKDILSKSTFDRRLSNIKKLITIVSDRLNEELYGTKY